MIKKVKKEALTTAHYALLYEADPSKKMVEDYITRGICFDYQTEELQGILVLLPTHPRTLEIVNILPLILPKKKSMITWRLGLGAQAFNSYISTKKSVFE